MASEFAEVVEAIVGPLLADLGFTLDEIDGGPDEGGRPREIVYYRSRDCKIQIYDSRREGEVNCMIAPANVLNEFGLNVKKWHFLDRFTERGSPPTVESVRSAIAEYRSYANPVEWVRDRIAKHYADAHQGILRMYKED